MKAWTTVLGRKKKKVMGRRDKWPIVPKYVKERMFEIKATLGLSLNQQAKLFLDHLLEKELPWGDVPVVEEEEVLHLYNIDMEKVARVQKRLSGISEAGAIRYALIYGVQLDRLLLKE